MTEGEVGREGNRRGDEEFAALEGLEEEEVEEDEWKG